MEAMTIDRGWRFRWTTNGQTRNQSNEWRSVDLPHDFSIIQARDPQAPGGVAHYEKAIEIPEEWAGHRILVEFEGVYMRIRFWSRSTTARYRTAAGTADRESTAMYVSMSFPSFTSLRGASQ